MRPSKTLYTSDQNAAQPLSTIVYDLFTSFVQDKAPKFCSLQMSEELVWELCTQAGPIGEAIQEAYTFDLMFTNSIP